MPGSDLPGVIEAISAAVIPVAGGLAAAVKWRRSAQNNRNAREEAARIAGENAASAARQEVKVEKARTDAVNERLLQEKDVQIADLRQQLVSERRENAEKDNIIRELMRGTWKPQSPGGAQ